MDAGAAEASKGIGGSWRELVKVEREPLKVRPAAIKGVAGGFKGDVRGDGVMESWQRGSQPASGRRKAGTESAGNFSVCFPI